MLRVSYCRYGILAALVLAALVMAGAVGLGAFPPGVTAQAAGTLSNCASFGPTSHLAVAGQFGCSPSIISANPSQALLADKDKPAKPPVLSDPTVSPPLVVNSTADTDDGACSTPGSGPGNHDCTLREAINATNANPGYEKIIFNIPGGGVKTIAPTSPLPAITDALTIDGASRPGASCPDELMIELSGANAGAGATGLTFNSSYNSINGLVINRFQTAVKLQSPTASQNIGTIIFCSRLGTTPDGSATFPGQAVGVRITNSRSNGVGGIYPAGAQIAGFSQAGILIEGSESTLNYIEGNFIGTNANRTKALPNGTGILIDNAPANFIGSSESADRANVISGNSGDGVLIKGSGASGNNLTDNAIGPTELYDFNLSPLGNGGTGVHIQNAPNTVLSSNYVSGNGAYGIEVEGNGASGTGIYSNNVGLVGTSDDPAGCNGLDGVYIKDAPGNLIKPDPEIPWAGNTIGPNKRHGIHIEGSGATGNQVKSTRLTRRYSGNTPDPCNSLDGVLIENAPGNVIGGTGFTNFDEANFIDHWGRDGIHLIGTGATGNSLRGNQISDNGGLGIELDPAGVTPNDPGDGDSGPNGLQNFPVITSTGSNKVQGTLNSQPNATFELDFYFNDTCDLSGYGEGQYYLGLTHVTTDAIGQANFSFTTLAGGFVTATATDANGNTSEFSGCQVKMSEVFIREQPVPRSIAAGQNVTLNVMALGAFPLSYQWYQGVRGDTATPVGSNSASFTTPNLAVTTSYWVRVSNPYSTADSQAAIIAVNCAAPLSVSQGTDTGAGGCGTLSNALGTALGLSGNQSVTFGVTSLSLSGSLPVVRSQAGSRLTIDGGCTVANNRGRPGVALVGTAEAAPNALTVAGQVTVRGLWIKSFSGFALDIWGEDNEVVCSWLGAVEGSGGSNGGGIRLGTPEPDSITTANTLIGRSAEPASGNVIAGNSGPGIEFNFGTGNTAYYNWIGLKADGSPAKNLGGAVRARRGGALLFKAGNRLRN